MSQKKTVGRRSSRGKPFVKGHEKLGGRQAGTPNLATVILQTAAQLGSKNDMVDYLKKIAISHPGAFVRLLARLFPKRPGSVRGSRIR